jgi:rare lipoprotein A
MNQRFGISLTATLLATAFGTTASTAFSVRSAVALDKEEISSIIEQSSIAISPPNLSKSVKSPGTLHLPTEESDNQNKEIIASIFAYQLGDEPAATLYVRGIPILTFTGAESNQAQAFADRLNQMYNEDFDAETLSVTWNQQKQSYTIKAGEAELITLSKSVMLADSTGKLSEDSLQATNRFRRLLGNAAPLEGIAGIQPSKQPNQPQPQQVAVRSQVQGIASWYGPGFHGRRSASGERFNQNALTAAHRTLPFGTKVRVTNLNNGRSVIVRINDRGPYSGRRVIDLSAAAAQNIGMISSGTAKVKLEILQN